MWDTWGKLTIVTLPNTDVISYKYDGHGRKAQVLKNGVLEKVFYIKINFHPWPRWTALAKSKYTSKINSCKDLKLISEVHNISSELNAFQILVSEKLFDVNNFKCDGNIIFEETIIYSDLSMKGMISWVNKKLPCL